MASYPRIFGINTSFISSVIYDIVNIRRDGESEEAVREAAVKAATERFLYNSTIQRNMRIVHNRGSVFEAINYYNLDFNNLNFNDELIFSRQLAYKYVIDFINYRVNEELNAINNRPVAIREINNNSISDEAEIFINRATRNNRRDNLIAERVARNEARELQEYREGYIAFTTSPANIEELEPNLTCSICLCDVQEETGRGWLKTRCGHHFHRHCLNQVRGNNCPNCRASFSA
jgi:hypothetical protein